MLNNYLDLIANFGIGGAHPGGFSLTQSILEKETIQPNESVLDIGCGTGQTAAFLARRYLCQVTAVDNHPIMLMKAKKRFESIDSPILVIEGDAQNLKLKDNTFDFIIAESVISFTTISKTLNELCRVLKSGGRLILIEMTAEQPLLEEIRQQACNLYGINEILNEEEWKSRLQQAGFSQVEIIETPSGLSHTEVYESHQSENITMDLYDIWDAHNRFITQYHEQIGYRAFRSYLK